MAKEHRPRGPDRLVVDLLTPMEQHRAVRLVEDVASDLDDEVGPDSEEVPVECGVVCEQSASPLGTTGSPRGSPSGTM